MKKKQQQEIIALPGGHVWDSVVNFQFSGINFTSLAQKVTFHFLLEKAGRFHVSYIVWDIIPNFCTDIGKSLFWDFQSGYRNL